MKIKYRLFVAALTILLVTIGCYSHFSYTDETMIIEKATSGNGNYEVVKKISNNRKILKMKEILDKPRYGTGTVDMSIGNDYVIRFINNNVKKSDLLEAYFVWISPKKDHLIITRKVAGGIRHIGQEDSSVIYELITGGKLKEE